MVQALIYGAKYIIESYLMKSVNWIENLGLNIEVCGWVCVHVVGVFVVGFF